MEPEQTPNPSVNPDMPPMSLGARLANVFAVPGDVFETVKAGTPSLANWLVPLLLSCLAGVIHTILIFSQDVTLHQIQELQERSIQKRLEKLSKADAEKTREVMERFLSPAFLKITGSIGAVGWAGLSLFLTGLFLWLVGTRMLKGTFSLRQAMEVGGLAGMIGVLGSVVTTLLVAGMGNIMLTPGPALLVSDFDVKSKLHLALASINVMTFWHLGVLTVGLAKLSAASCKEAALWVFVPWAIYRSSFILAGWGAAGL